MSHRVWKDMPIKVRGGRNRRPRPKTFESEEDAKSWAKEQGLSEFEIKPVGLGKKLKVVPKG